MEQKEGQWDKLLKVRTSGRDDSHSDRYHYPYEPTPYCVLERLAETGLIGKKQTLLDYGTGKGRVCFFMSYQTRCFSVGIEYNERIFQNAQENKKHAVSGSRTDFVMENAESYVIPEAVNRCYFFNPFSVEILRKVLARIYDSYYGNKRKILLFFYYPSDEYLGFLMTEEHLLFSAEISCEDLFPGENNRERILVFEVV